MSEKVYPKISSKLCIGEKALTATQAKKLLGWTEEKGDKFSEWLLLDYHKQKIQCYNNLSNRPLYRTNVLNLKQEILNGRWEFNGETIIIGEDGTILNGQHQLIALVLAFQEWEDTDDKWQEFWPTAPTLDKLLVTGVSEKDSVVNTMDTCKPRTLSDVIFRSPFFAKLPAKERRQASSQMEYALRTIWHRTGASLDAFAPRKTHAEFLALLEKHPRLVEAVTHTYEEDGDDKRIRRFLSPGYAAGLLYLMGTSSSADETELDFSNWETACDFFVCLAGDDPKFSAVKTAFTKLLNTTGASINERMALIVKAWLSFLSGKPITEATLKLKYNKAKEDGELPELAELPVVGGLDFGEPTADKAELENAKVDPTPEEITQRAKKERVKRAKKPTPTKKKSVKKKSVKKKKKKTAKRFSLERGKIVWVDGSDEEPWKGKIVDVLEKECLVRVSQGFVGAGNELMIPKTDLKAKQPIRKG